MSTIGFLSTPMAEKPEVHNMDNRLFTFDSGRGITFEEAVRSTLVMGGTGSGKTSSIVLPMCHNLIKAGFAGLIIDVKGNLGKQVRRIAKECGREGDIVEFGSSSTACKTNLLDGLRDHETASIFDILATSGVEEDRNIAWHQKGARMAQDIAFVLRSLSMVNPGCHFSRQFRPTLKAVSAILNNKVLARNIWNFYVIELKKAQAVPRKHGCTSYLQEAENFVQEISSQGFHVFKTPAKERTVRGKENNEEQQTWMLQRITGQFKNLNTTHGLLDRFSCLDDSAVPINFYDLVYRQKKIVLVHFSPDCGPAANILARIIKERFYMALFEKGLSHDAYTFMVNDEFQNTMNMSARNRFSDMELFSVSREFRNINVIATQSVASLYAKGNSHAVTSLLANCTNKILLQTRDPQTIKWAREAFDYCLPSAGELRRGECLMDMLNANGEVVSVQDNVQNAYQDMCTLLKEPAPPKLDDSPRRKALPKSATGLPLEVEAVLTRNCEDDQLMQLSLAAHLICMREASVQGKNYLEVELGPKLPKSLAFLAQDIADSQEQPMEDTRGKQSHKSEPDPWYQEMFRTARVKRRNKGEK